VRPLELKYDGKPAPITPEQIINPRRVLDRGQDLWTTFNVVQENVIRGGFVAERKKEDDQNAGSHRNRW
jgi:hypothetical protein